MMQPIIPPATGPTGALLIILRDATSSSEKEWQEERSLIGLKGVKLCKCEFVEFLLQNTRQFLGGSSGVHLKHHKT